MSSASTIRRIVGGTVLSMAPGSAPIHDGEVTWDDNGTITYVGPRLQDRVDGDSLEETTLDAGGGIIMPGLVNGHAHTGMTLLRGVEDSKAFVPWLAAVREREEVTTAEEFRLGLRLGMAEMIRNGVTSFCDMFHWDELLLNDVVAAGLRVTATPVVFAHEGIAYANAWSINGAEVLDLTEQLARDFADDPMVNIFFAPHAPYTASPELYREIAERAGNTGLGIHTHLSETAGEVERSIGEHGITPIKLMQQLGVFDVQTVVAHAVHVTPEDIEILAAANALVVPNPVSNLKLGSGIAPIATLHRRGVRLGLGTDSVASNNTLDLLEEVKLAALLPRIVHDDRGPEVLSPADILAMVTRDGAAGIGFGDVAGQLLVGMQADVIVVDQTRPSAVPVNEPNGHIVFSTDGGDVRDVIVNGHIVMTNRVVHTIDVEQTIADVSRCVAQWA